MVAQKTALRSSNANTNECRTPFKAGFSDDCSYFLTKKNTLKVNSNVVCFTALPTSTTIGPLCSVPTCQMARFTPIYRFWAPPAHPGARMGASRVHPGASKATMLYTTLVGISGHCHGCCEAVQGASRCIQGRIQAHPGASKGASRRIQAHPGASRGFFRHFQCW